MKTIFFPPSRNEMKIGQGPLDVYTFFMVLSLKGNETQMLLMIFFSLIKRLNHLKIT